MAKSKVRRKKKLVYSEPEGSSETNYVAEENNQDSFYIMAMFIGVFAAAWAAAGLGIWNLVINSGGSITFAWIAAIVGGFIGAALFFLLGSFFLQG